MIRRRQLLAATTVVLAAPPIVERANAQSAFDWKQFKGQSIEVNYQLSPRGDVAKAHMKEFEELTGMTVGFEQIPEQQGGRLVEQIRITPAGTAGGTAITLAKLGAEVRSAGF